nr:uncharacterized protein LOC111420025 [Onthophagus taurus]
MTVTKSTTSASSTTKKKQQSSSSATTSSSTTVQSSRKEVKQHHQEALSKSSSASSLQISDISHLPVSSNVVSYTVTESLPHGEKITKYEESGATSTEYRHHVNQDQSSNFASNIQQISSTLNQSTSNLSQISAATDETYIVHEPREELKVVNKNDSAWNGKFVYEQSSSASQKKSYKEKSSSSSYVVEIVDGKERIVDRKHHETEFADASSNEEHLSMKSGTDIVPEVHYKQKSTKESLEYDSANPDLQKPKIKSSEAGREVHKHGQIESTSHYLNEDVDLKRIDQGLDVSSKKSLSKTEKEEKKMLSKTETSSKATSSKTISKSTTSSSTQNEDIQAVGDGCSETIITTTTTYYDSKGNILKTDTDVDVTKADTIEKLPIRTTPGTTTILTTTIYYDSKGNIIKEENDFDTKILDSQKLRDTENYTVRSRSDNNQDVSESTTKYVDKRYVDERYVDEKNVVSSSNISKQTLEESQRIKSDDYDLKTKDFSQTKKYVSGVPTDYSKNIDDKTDLRRLETVEGVQDSTNVRYVDENYVDTSKIRNQQTATDSKNFYGHSYDSSGTVVKNVYDTTAVQNTIGTRGKVIKTDTQETDVIYSNDRNYGKTGWNGKFIYETPQKRSPSKSPDRKTPMRKPEKSPERKSPDRKGRKKTPEDVSTKLIDQESGISKNIDVKTSSDTKTFIDKEKVTSKIVDDKELIDYVIIDDTKTKSKDSKTNIEKSKTDVSKTVDSIDDKVITEYVIIGGVRRPRTRKLRPDEISTMKIDEKYQTTKQSFTDSKTIIDNQDITEYVVIDGKRLKRPDDIQHPRGPGLDEIDRFHDTKTITESFETVTNLKDSKTTVIKDDQKFEDVKKTVEHYTTTDKYDSTKDGPKKIDDKPRKDLGPKTKTIVTDKEIFSDIKDFVSKVDRKDVHVVENIVDIKDIEHVENVTKIDRFTDNKVINIVKTVKEETKPDKHYRPPLKEQCICELCTCG